MSTSESQNALNAEVSGENLSKEGNVEILASNSPVFGSRKRKRLCSIFPNPAEIVVAGPSTAETSSIPSTSAGNPLNIVVPVQELQNNNNLITVEKEKEKDPQKSRGPYQAWNAKTVEHFFDALKQVGTVVKY